MVSKLDLVLVVAVIFLLLYFVHHFSSYKSKHMCYHPLNDTEVKEFVKLNGITAIAIKNINNYTVIAFYKPYNGTLVTGFYAVAKYEDNTITWSYAEGCCGCCGWVGAKDFIVKFWMENGTCKAKIVPK